MKLATRACLHTVLYTVYNEDTEEIEKDGVGITDALELMWYLNKSNNTNSWNYRLAIHY